MKKPIVFLSVLVLLVVLAGCGGQSSTPAQPNSKASTHNCK